LREVLRDRRTIVTLVLMPVLLYPLLSIAFRQYFLSSVATTTEKVYRVAIPTDEEAYHLAKLLRLHKEDPKLMQVKTEDLVGSIRSEEADVGLRLRGPTPGGPYECDILFRDDRAVAVTAAEFLKERLNQANIHELLRQVHERGRDSVIPVGIKMEIIPAVEGKEQSLLASLVPLILVL